MMLSEIEEHTEVMDRVKLAYIIDDDDVIIYHTNQILERESFCERREIFSSAETAMTELRKALAENNDVPDVILFDVHLIGSDGWSFIDEFIKLKTNIPAFVFTSSIDSKDRQRSFRYKEIKGFITKPLTKNSLNKIKRLIG